MKVLVCGGREYDNAYRVFETLSDLFIRSEKYGRMSEIELVQGGAKGADFLGRCWARCNGINHTEIKAEWNKFSRAAGIKRNEKMLSYGPDIVVAFPGGKGTAHMVKISKEAGIKVLEVKE